MGGNIVSVKKPKHWSLGLLDSMKDPELIVEQNERVVVIRDKYPKSKIHYLVLPREDIISIYKLNHTHISLLEEFGQVYFCLTERHRDYVLRAGFHAVPSMQRLHMHIISTDMISSSLKTRIHWNSFTTDFFLSYEDVLKELKGNGCIKEISKADHEKFITKSLECNQCSFKPKNMPSLKAHLLTHVK